MIVLMITRMRMLMMMLMMMLQLVESAVESLRPRMRMVMGRTQSQVQPVRLRGTPVILMLLLMVLVVMMMMHLMMLTMLMMMMTTPPCLPLTPHLVVYDLGWSNVQPAEVIGEWVGRKLTKMKMMMMMMVMVMGSSTVCGERERGDACTKRPVTNPESTSAPSSNHMLEEPILLPPYSCADLPFASPTRAE
jgi:hypothetical protein